LTFNEAVEAQFVEEGNNSWRLAWRRQKKTNPISTAGLLCTRGERPRDCRAPNESDKFPSIHVLCPRAAAILSGSADCPKEGATTLDNEAARWLMSALGELLPPKQPRNSFAVAAVKGH